MAVYTRIGADDLRALLDDYAIGGLQCYRGIAAGITNSNYFVDTTRGRWVLTLFEQAEEAAALPFFMRLMDHLAARGVPDAHPVARSDGGFLSRIRGRPAALVYRLPGASLEAPGTSHCAALGGVVAAMHRAARSFVDSRPNPRNLAWVVAARGQLYGALNADRRALLDDEIAFQRRAARTRFVGLPRAVIHADLFRDNVLFEDARVCGVIDFYYACRECLLFELAVICNDWAFDDEQRYLGRRWAAFVAAYHRRRALTAGEVGAWGAMLRAAALRFWVSRLLDYHFPTAGDVTHVHDPAPFERLLRRHREAAPALFER